MCDVSRLYPCRKCDQCKRVRKNKIIRDITRLAPLYDYCNYLTISPRPDDSYGDWWSAHEYLELCLKAVRQIVQPYRMWGFYEKAGQYHTHALLLAPYPMFTHHEFPLTKKEAVLMRALNVQNRGGFHNVELNEVKPKLVRYLTKYLTKEEFTFTVNYFQYTRPFTVKYENRDLPF